VRELPAGLDCGLVGDGAVEVDEGEGAPLGVKTIAANSGPPIAVTAAFMSF